MKQPLWIQHNFFLALHEDLIATYGGRLGIRETGLLDSALNRPQHLFAYEKPNLFELAATYSSGIIRNHPFIDGNKRTALVSGIVFLERNEKSFNAPEAETTQAVLDLVENKITEKEYSLWLKKNSISRK